MKKVDGRDRVHQGELHYLALALADWWTRPDAERIARWDSAEYRDQVLLLWQSTLGISSSVEKLLSALCLQLRQMKDEYERLFVGPAALPCPPYEAVWRTDRPKQEQGTVIGRSTVEVKQLYSELGFQLRGDQVELPDHIAIEVEALACAWGIGDTMRADRLVGQLQHWLPPFCAAVAANSKVKFYRNLAEVTWEFFSSGKIKNLGEPQQMQDGLQEQPVSNDF